MRLTRRQFTALLGTPWVSLATAAAPERLYDKVSSPVGMGFDAQHRLYVAEWSADRVTRFDADGGREVVSSGLGGPAGLVVAPDNSLYIASYGDNVVWHITSDGKRSQYIRGLATPAGLSFDQEGRLMIANRETNEILRVEEGKAKSLIEGLRTPVGVVQTLDMGYVVSNINGGVTIVRPDGSRLEAGQAFRKPGPGVASTRDGRVFVVDYGGTTVREILPDGRSRLTVDGLPSPAGLVASPDGRELYVATWGDNAVYRFIP